MSKIPDGYTSLTPYITFDDVNAAIELYQKALGAEVIMSMPAPDGTILHAELQIGTARIMVSGIGDDCKSAKSLGGSPVLFYYYADDVQAAFNKAKNAGMTEKNPIKDMFWGDRIGTLTDPFGIDWTIAEHVRDVSPEEIEQAKKEMFS